MQQPDLIQIEEGKKAIKYLHHIIYSFSIDEKFENIREKLRQVENIDKRREYLTTKFRKYMGNFLFKTGPNMEGELVEEIMEEEFLCQFQKRTNIGVGFIPFYNPNYNTRLIMNAFTGEFFDFFDYIEKKNEIEILD